MHVVGVQNLWKTRLKKQRYGTDCHKVGFTLSGGPANCTKSWSDGVTGRYHERSERDMCRGLLNLFKEDVMKLFLSLISESVHVRGELEPPEQWVWTFGKLRYVLEASS